jgi:hypothetical protein
MVHRIAAVVVVALAGSAFADPIPKGANEIPKIQKTSWIGTDSLGSTITYTFLEDGKLEYVSQHKGEQPNTYRNGSWTQVGKKVSWETNNHYADYTGTVSKTQMVMEAKNVTGLTWTITLKPVPKDEKQ